MLKSEYLQKILKLCDPALGVRAGFLGSEERYQRLHQLASQGRMASVRADLTNTSFANVARVLRENGMLVSVLDVSNAPDYFLHSEGHRNDVYRLNLQQLAWTTDAEVLFTSGMIPMIDKQGLWNYLRFSARDYIFELGALLKWGSYSMFLFSDETKARVISPAMSCRQLF